MYRWRELVARDQAAHGHELQTRASEGKPARLNDGSRAGMSRS
jgi:hypothetical protein